MNPKSFLFNFWGHLNSRHTLLFFFACIFAAVCFSFFFSPASDAISFYVSAKFGGSPSPQCPVSGTAIPLIPTSRNVLCPAPPFPSSPHPAMSCPREFRERFLASMRFFVHCVGCHPTIFHKNLIFLTFPSSKICIYQKKCVSLHSISKVFFFPFGATACDHTFQCPTTFRFTPQPPQSHNRLANIPPHPASPTHSLRPATAST